MKTIKKQTLKIFLLAFLLVLTSCFNFSDDYIVKGIGPVVTDVRSHNDFNTIWSQIGANINVHDSTSFHMTISMQENLFPYLETGVENKVLNINFGNRSVSTDIPITIDIYMPVLNRFYLSGAGEVHSGLAPAEIVLSGAGLMVFAGQRDNVEVRIPGYGSVDLYGMPVKNATIVIAGNGAVKVDVETKLNVTISGMGTVTYKGNPQIVQEISGMGSLIHEN
jgi:hypothetical protein